jgi:cobalt-zinc-cadmium efflux system outer membrane protein
MEHSMSMLLLLALAVPAAGEAPAASTGTLTLERALEEARRANPELRAALKGWEAARKRIVSASTPDKPRLDIERMYAPSGRSPLTGADEKGLALTQEVPFPTTLYLRGSFAAREAGMAEQAYRAKEREVLARVRAFYAMLYLAQRSRDIFEENIALMRRFSRVAESKYAAGRAPQSDALKAQVELTKMLNMREVVEQDLESAQAMLAAALGRDARSPLGDVPEPGLSALPAAEELEGAALADRPELRGARLGVGRAGRSLALARSEFLPDLMLMYRRRRDPMRGTTSDAALGLSLPLWFWKPAAMAAEAKAEKEMSEAELESMRLMTLSEVRSAYVRARTAARLAEVYRSSLLPQAEAALKVAETGYQAEKVGFLDLLDAQRSLLDFRLEYHQYQAEHQSRLAELERVVGRGL